MISTDKELQSMNTGPFTSRPPVIFFLLVFALSIPFWLIGAAIGVQLLPGLPVSAFMIVCPLTAALILVYRENGIAGVTGLLKRAFDAKRIRAKVWYVPTILFMPGVMALSYGLMRLTGTPVPTPQFTILAPFMMFLMFFVGALSEELGWSGYAIDRLQERQNALQASITLGLIWAAWHIVPFIQADRSPDWIAWQCLNLVATRIIHVWLYSNAGKSVFSMAVFHAMGNVTWQLFPVNGSYYDPRVTSLIVTFIAAFFAVVWGPRTLAEYKHVRLRWSAISR
jgi:membrane protease YdiL (CAAX protease family)